MWYRSLYIVGFLTAVVIAVFAYMAFFVYTPMFECENFIFEEVASPNGDSRAILFQRNCGATTKFSWHVSTLPVGDELPNDSGNLLSAPGTVGSRHIQWAGDEKIVVIGGDPIDRESAFIAVYPEVGFQ